MVSKISDMVTEGQMGYVLLPLFLIGYFIYKEWPDFKKRVSHGAVKEEAEIRNDRSISERLQSIEERLCKIDEKLMRDYNRINRIEIETEKNKHMLAESLEEREVIMKALLGALGGLQELGANGPTKQAEQEIRDYLNQQAHRPDMV